MNYGCPLLVAARGFTRRRLLTVVVKAFGFALVANLAGFRFFCRRFVIGFGPVVAVRAEMPYVTVAFASIDLCRRCFWNQCEGRVIEVVQKVLREVLKKLLIWFLKK